MRDAAVHFPELTFLANEGWGLGSGEQPCGGGITVSTIPFFKELL